MSQAVRIDWETHERLRVLAKRLDEPMSTVVQKAVAALEEQTFWRAVNESVELEHNDGSARAQQDVWDNTLMDGIAEDEPHPVGTDGLPTIPR